MSKKVAKVVKLQIPAGQAKPGPALASAGIMMPKFCSDFNAKTADRAGEIVPVIITAYEDKSYDFVLKTTPATFKLKEAAKINKGSATPNSVKVGKVTKEQIKAIVKKLPLSNLSLEGWDGTKTEEKFDSPVWDELFKPCLACGTCTFVCPTCQCYDIKDYKTANGIQKYRCWDSCMYSDFTMMAHGNNRTSQLQRFRQRFMHKLVYFPANNDGMYSCVGCGRCVDKCPASANIIKVIKAFSKEGK